jgi:hypothetical protein
MLSGFVTVAQKREGLRFRRTDLLGHKLLAHPACSYEHSGKKTVDYSVVISCVSALHGVEIANLDTARNY